VYKVSYDVAALRFNPTADFQFPLNQDTTTFGCSTRRKIGVPLMKLLLPTASLLAAIGAGFCRFFQWDLEFYSLLAFSAAAIYIWLNSGGDSTIGDVSKVEIEDAMREIGRIDAD
jgi:hypothetical protein